MIVLSYKFCFILITWSTSTAHKWARFTLTLFTDTTNPQAIRWQMLTSIELVRDLIKVFPSLSALIDARHSLKAQSFGREAGSPASTTNNRTLGNSSLIPYLHDSTFQEELNSYNLSGKPNTAVSCKANGTFMLFKAFRKLLLNIYCSL